MFVEHNKISLTLSPVSGIINHNSFTTVIPMTQIPPHNTEAAVSRQLKIEECLLQNMAQLPYDRISVADLCRQMGISRRLYYTYFPDKDACLISIIDRVVRESIESLPDVPINSDSMFSVTVAYLSYWREHADFLDLVVRNNLKALIVERSFLYFKNHEHNVLNLLNTPQFKADDSILWLYVAIRYVVLWQWHENQYALSVEEMAAKYLRMLKQPIIQDPA